MEELTREQDGTTHPEPLHYRELCRWEDEQHIYLEADLGTDLGSYCRYLHLWRSGLHPDDSVLGPADVPKEWAWSGVER